MTTFIGVTIYEGQGDTTFLKQIIINPDYIISMEEDDKKRSIIHLSDGRVLHVVESLDDMNKLLGKLNTYIG